MWREILGSIRSAANTALPSGIFSSVLFDALKPTLDLLTSQSRIASIQTELGESVRKTIGPRPRYETPGFLQVVLYEPEGTGDGEQLSYSDTVSDALREKRLTGTGYTVRMKGPTVNNGLREGSHFVRVVRVPFIVQHYPTLAS